MYISSVSLPLNEPYQTLVSLSQSILCGYDNVTFFVGGVPGMPHSFGCEATDWLRGIWHLESVFSFWMEPPLFRYLKE